jgi:hypothetical protein
MIFALIISSCVAVISLSSAAWYYQKAASLQRKLDMAVFAELEPALAELAASIAALPAKIAAGDPAAAAQLAQDKADSVAAVQAQADALKGIVGA